MASRGSMAAFPGGRSGTELVECDADGPFGGFGHERDRADGKSAIAEGREEPFAVGGRGHKQPAGECDRERPAEVQLAGRGGRGRRKFAGRFVNNVLRGRIAGRRGFQHNRSQRREGRTVATAVHDADEFLRPGKPVGREKAVGERGDLCPAIGRAGRGS